MPKRRSWPCSWAVRGRGLKGTYKKSGSEISEPLFLSMRLFLRLGLGLGDDLVLDGLRRVLVADKGEGE